MAAWRMLQLALGFVATVLAACPWLDDKVSHANTSVVLAYLCHVVRPGVSLLFSVTSRTLRGRTRRCQGSQMFLSVVVEQSFHLRFHIRSHWQCGQGHSMQLQQR